MKTYQTLMEMPVIRSQRGTKLSVLLTRPDAQGVFPCVLAVHGYCSSKSEFGLYDRLSNTLAAMGIACIRFDFPGCGDSKEPYTQYTNQNMQADMDTVYQWLRVQLWADASRIGIQGYSMGGRQTVLFATRHREISSISLWAAALTNGTELCSMFLGGEEMERENYETAMRDGFFMHKDKYGERPLSLRFIQENLLLNPYVLLADYTGGIFIAQGMEDEVVAGRGVWYAELAAQSSRLFDKVIFPTARHDLGTGFGTGPVDQNVIDTLIQRTTAFFEKELACE